MTEANRQQEYYRDLWRRFDQAPNHDEQSRLDEVLRALRHHAGPALREPRHVLDLGCGRGWMGPFLAEFGFVLGVDFDIETLNRASKLYPEVQFILGNASDPRYGVPETVRPQIVVCSEVIEHVSDQINLISTIRALLCPRGLLVLTTPNGRLFRHWVRSEYGFHRQPCENWLTPRVLSALLRQNGFSVLEHRTFRCIPLPGTGVLRFLDLRWVDRLPRFLHQVVDRLTGRFGIYQIIVARTRTG